MKKSIFFALLLVSVCVRPVLSQGNTVNLPSAAHSAGSLASYYVDPNTGKKVYRLSDRSLCPGGASHFYSYSNQFSIAGDIVFDCKYDASNGNLMSFPVYDKNLKLLYANAVTAANAPNISFRMTQWSQSRRVLFAQQGTRLWELDPFNGTSRQIADFGGKTFTTSSGGTLTVGNIVALSVGPGDRLMVHVQPVGNYTVMAIGTFELATGRYSFLGVPVSGQYAPQGFDEATYSQNPNGRVTLQNAYASAYSYTSNLSSPIKYDDNNGHRGFFCGSNGRCYKTSTKNDTLANGAVGQLGCAGSSPWISEHALYNDATGKRELVWSCDMPAGSVLRQAMGHFSRSQAPNAFFGTGSNAPIVDWIARYQVTYDASGNPNKVTGTPVATARSNSQACGYWAQPRATSDPTGTRALFDSSANNTTYISKENGVAKTSCITDVYVAEYSSAPAVTLSVTPGSLSFATPLNVNPSAQTIQVTTSSSTQSWTASSNQSWLTLNKTAGTGSASVGVSINAFGLLAGAFSGTVTITAGGASGSPASVNVSLSIAAAPGVISLSMAPNPVITPASSTGTVTLSAAAPSGGRVVALSSNQSFATVPSSVTVAAGQTKATFQATVAQVQQRTQATITATSNGSVQAVLIADPPPATLVSESVTPSVVNAGNAATGSVTLSAPAPSGGRYVTLSSNNAAATVPAGVTVPAGSTSANFTVVTSMTLTQQQATLSATYSGKTVQVILTVKPPTLLSVSMAPATIDSGLNSTGTVTLSSPAPSGGAVVTLLSNFAAVIPPPSVTIPAGQTSATFTIGSWVVAKSWPFTISATWNGVMVQAFGTLMP